MQAVSTWMGWEGRGAPPGGPAAVWLAVFFKVWLSVTFDFIKKFALRRYCTKRGISSSLPLPVRGEAGTTSVTPIQRLLVNITELWVLQFSCVLDGSTSLWPNGSASVLHLLAGLSCAVAVSL